MKYYNLIFAVFHLWRLAITTLDKQSCFFIIITINLDLFQTYNKLLDTNSMTTE